MDGRECDGRNAEFGRRVGALSDFKLILNKHDTSFEFIDCHLARVSRVAHDTLTCHLTRVRIRFRIIDRMESLRVRGDRCHGP